MIVRVSAEGEIIGVKVVTGETLASLDPTGTLTKKYQARWIRSIDGIPHLLDENTDVLRSIIQSNNKLSTHSSPADSPQASQLLGIQEIFDILMTLIGSSFPDVGYDQERIRG